MTNLIKMLAFCVTASTLQAAQISGTVFYDGEPVSNALIYVQGITETSSGETTIPLRTVKKTITASDGFYELNVATNANYTVEAIPPEPTDLLSTYYPNAVDSRNAVRLSVIEETSLTNINIHLSLGAVVCGTVQSSGQPIENARIYLTNANGKRQIGNSDTNGAFRGVTPPGTGYTATAYPPPDSGVLNQTYSNTFAAFVDVPTTNINFELPPAACISGTVRSGTNPVPSASIRFYRQDEGEYLFTKGYTDTNGNYSALVPPASNYIARVYPLTDSGLLGEYYENVDNPDDAVLLSVTVESPLTGIDFDIEEAAWISGTIYDGAVAASNAYVRLEKRIYDTAGSVSGFEFIASTYTDGNGSYSFPVNEGTNYILSAALPSNPYIISISQRPRLYYPAAYPIENATAISTTRNSPAENIDIDLSGLAVICGTVSADGVPVADSTITVYQKNQTGTSVVEGISLYFISSFTTGKTDTNGTYSVRLSPGSNYYVRVEAPDGSALIPKYYNNALTTEDAVFFSLELDQTISGIDFDLSPGFRIQGNVSYQNNQSVPNPHIYVRDIHGNQLNSATGASDGTYAAYAPTGTSVTISASGSSCRFEYYRDTFSSSLAQKFSGNIDDIFTANFVLFAVNSDRDGDGLMDYLEDTVPDGIFTPGVDYSDFLDADTDRDGQNDNTEKLCRTDPYNPWDYLYIRDFTSEPGSVHFSWVAESGVQYQVERCSDLSEGQWTPISDLFIGQGLLKQFSDTSAPSEPTYYRIRVITP